MKMEDHFALPVRACTHGGGVEDANSDIALVTVGTEAMEDYDQTSIAAAHAINCHDELVEALRPFAEMADARDKAAVAFLRETGEAAAKNASDTELAALFAPDSDVVITDGALVSPHALTWGAFRRARAILTKAKG